MQKNQMPKEMENELKTAQALREEAIRDHAKELLKNGNMRDLFAVPTNVAKFMLDVLTCPEGETIYNPFAGIGSFANHAPKNHFVQRENYAEACAIAQLRAEENGVTPQIEYCDSMETTDQWSYIISMPPFIPNKMDEIIMHLYSQLKEGGVMCLLLPTSFTFTSRRNSARELLLKENALTHIYEMPHGIFMPTMGVNTVIVRIYKPTAAEKGLDISVTLSDYSSFYIEDRKAHKVIFNIEAHTESVAEELLGTASYSVSIPTSEILQTSNMVLSAKYYKSLDELEKIHHSHPLVTLGELLQPVFPESFYENSKKITVKDLGKNKLASATNFADVAEQKHSGKVQIVQTADILVALVGSELKPTIYNGEQPMALASNSNVGVLRVTDSKRVSPEYIVAELLASYVQKQIETFRTGVTLPSISLSILLGKVKIELPSIEEQEKQILERTIETQKRVLEQQGIAYDELLDVRRNDYNKRMRARKHAIGQVLNHMDPALDTLMRFMETHDGVIRDTDLVSQRYSRTVSDYFESLRAQLSQVIQMVNHLTDGEQYGKPEDFYVSGLIQRYIDSHPSSANFKFDLIWDQFPDDIDFEGGEVDGEYIEPVHIKAGPFDPYQISIAQEDFFQVLDNIVSNAVKYGFTESKDYCIKISSKQTKLHHKPAVAITIANNGNPLPKGITEENVFAYGASTNGSGIGGAQMKDIIEYFNGEIRLNSYLEAEDGFTIEYVITLPVNNIITSDEL